MIRHTPRGIRALSTAASEKHHKFLVVGGGTGGVTAAAQLTRKLIQGRGNSNGEIKEGDIAIVEPKAQHYYQPGWTLAGTGLAAISGFSKAMKDVVSDNIQLIADKVVGFKPESNQVELTSGLVGYDYLILSPGTQLNINAVEGLEDALDDPKAPVSSVYKLETVEKTWNNIESLREGKAIFTQPAGMIKCAGAPQKIMWMAYSTFKQNGLLPNIEVEFVTGMPTMFAVPKYSQALDKLRQDRKIPGSFNTNLVAIDAFTKKATFNQTVDGKESKVKKDFDFIHVVPPQGPLDFMKQSSLVDEMGYITVSQNTLQHDKFSNIFALGDGSNVPTSKTAAAITGQTPVLIENLLSSIEGKELPALYDGYTSCPLLTGHDELMLAEFKYGAIPDESFSWLPFIGSQDVPRQAFYVLKKDFFPWVYWNRFVKGTWYGRSGPVGPSWL